MSVTITEFNVFVLAPDDATVFCDYLKSDIRDYRNYIDIFKTAQRIATDEPEKYADFANEHNLPTVINLNSISNNIKYYEQIIRIMNDFLAQNFENQIIVAPDSKDSEWKFLLEGNDADIFGVYVKSDISYYEEGIDILEEVLNASDSPEEFEALIVKHNLPASLTKELISQRLEATKHLVRVMKDVVLQSMH